MAETVAAAVAAFAAAATAATAAATTALVATGLSATVAAAVVSAGTQLVISAAAASTMSALSPKPKVNATASQLQTKVGAVTPRSIVMGRTAVAGTLLTPTPLKSGKDDRFASNFYALSHAGPSGVVESIQWGDDTVTFDGSGNAIGKYSDNMWLFQKNGDWNQAAISYTGHPVLGSSTPAAWDSTKPARGCLTVALVVRYAAKVLGGNMQTPIFVVDANAVALIDPRTGSPSTTQAQRRNPAVWAYSWRLGWFQNSKRVIGMGQPAAELHAAGYAYAANVADANGWTISGEATTADDRYAVESAMLLAAASVPVERNGLQSVVTSALRSSVGTITSNDLRADPKWRYNTQQSSRPTAIQTRFRSETNRWQMVEGAEVTDASWLTQDAGREKRVTVEYAYAGGGSAHVGHLAALDASNAREPLVFSLQCKQQARYAGFVGDAVTVSLPEIGLSSTKMVVVSRVVNPDGTVDYELLVETDAKYAFAAGKTSAAPSFTLQPGFDIFSVPQPDLADWASVAAQITSGATSLPIVRVTGSAANYNFASGVVFKIRLNSGGSPWLVSEDAPPAATQHEFRGLTNATSYIVGVAYRGVTGIEGPVRELAAVTTGVMVSGEAGSVPWTGVTGGGKPEDNATVGARVGTNIYPGSGSTPLPGTQLLNDQIGIDENGRLTNAGTGAAVVGNAQITIDVNGRLTTTGTGATVVDNTKITLTDGAVATVNNRVATEESARASADSAQASQITTLSARVDGRPNLFPYPQPITSRTPAQQGWLGYPIGALYAGLLGGMVYYRARAGGSTTTEVYYYDLPDLFYCDANNQYTLAASGQAGGSSNTVGDRLVMYLEFRSADNSTLLHITSGTHLNSSATRYTQTTNYTGGGVSGRLRVVFVREFAASGSYQDVVFSNIKLEAGTIATAFTNTAQVAQISSTSVDAYGRAYAISGTELEVNGRKGGFVIDNNGLVVNFQITADDFRVYQSIGGGYTVPFRVVGGQTQINDALIRTLNVIPDGGGPSHRVQLRPNSVSGADGATFTFSTAYGGIPLIRPVILQPPALAAGESYDISATNLSPSGFTIRAKKFTPGTPAAQSSGAGSNVGGTPQWQAQKPTSADGDGGQYTFSWTGNLALVGAEPMGGGYYQAYYYGAYDVYYNSGSGWVYAYTHSSNYSDLTLGYPPSTFSQSQSSTASLPAIGQHGGAEFGIHPSFGSITAFAGVSYTTTSQSSVVSLPGNFTFDIFAPT